MPVGPSRIPIDLVKWVQDPVEDLQLGHKILEDISLETDIVGYNA